MGADTLSEASLHKVWFVTVAPPTLNIHEHKVSAQESTQTPCYSSIRSQSVSLYNVVLNFVHYQQPLNNTKQKCFLTFLKKTNSPPHSSFKRYKINSLRHQQKSQHQLNASQMTSLHCR